MPLLAEALLAGTPPDPAVDVLASIGTEEANRLTVATLAEQKAVRQGTLHVTTAAGVSETLGDMVSPDTWTFRLQVKPFVDWIDHDEQGFWERMVGLGEIELYTTDETTTTVRLPYIRNAESVPGLTWPTMVIGGAAMDHLSHDGSRVGVAVDHVKLGPPVQLRGGHHPMHGSDDVAAPPEIRAARAELLADRPKLMMQMQAYAACDDPEVCAVVRKGYGEIVDTAATFGLATGVAGPGS